MRPRSNPKSERRRTERDAELRRRRHHRHMSQASERLHCMAQQLDLDFPAAPPSASSASSSSNATVSNTNPELYTARSSQPQDSPTSLPSAFDFTSNPVSHTSTFSASFSRYDDSPFLVPDRSRSNDGERRSESACDLYSRSLVRIQEQLDSMRAMLNGNVADDARNTLVLDTQSLNLERVLLEDEIREIMATRDGPGASFPADSVWPQRLAAAGNNEMRNRRLTPTLKSVSNVADAVKEAEKVRNTAAFLYTIEQAPTGSDVWPDVRDPFKVPAKFAPVNLSKSWWRHTSQSRDPSTKSANIEPDEESFSTKLVWPMNALPSEIYYLIAETLLRDDIKAMRLTCNEFEHHISGILFKTVVVPFNTEIYGMLQGISCSKADTTGKGKGKAIPTKTVEFWKNAKDEDIYTGHGVDVFRSFGRRMKRFGMSFEVDEEVLANPPLKGTREDHKTYWGVYQWPYPEYKRFDQVAGLEDAADETPKMKTAFSFLTEVQELALSLDAGLGWLAGPDRSIRSRIMTDHRPVFGTSNAISNRRQEARCWLWKYLKDWAIQNGTVDLRHCTVSATKATEFLSEYVGSLENLASISGLGAPFIELQGLVDPNARGLTIGPELSTTSMFSQSFGTSGPEGDQNNTTPSTNDSVSKGAPLETGLLFIKEDAIDPDPHDIYPIIPLELSKLQKEWLLETEWAQRAFLSSWLIAVVDNRYTFQNVHTMSFSRISSRFLLSLCREDFWRALPQLENLVIDVIPDYRDVIKDNAGFVETPRVLPVAAVWLLHKLLAEMISSRSTIKSLNIGWAGGGEFAQGLTTRNKHVMPAPVLPPEWLGSAENLADKGLLESQMLKFPHIKDLTLKNCWISPHALGYLVKEHPGLERLCLESVSLTAEMVHNQVPNAGQLMAMAQHTQGPLMPQHTIPAQGATIGLLANPQAPNHAFLQAVQNVNNLAGLHQAQTAPQFNSNGDWLSPRSGSWPYVLDAISPGITLAASGSRTSPVNIPASTYAHALQTLVLNSCGYCRLNNSRLDESAVPPPNYGGGSAWFQRRFTALSKVMLSPKPGITAEIVQYLPRSEEHALTIGFELSLGWPAQWAADVEAPIYDACLPGGTGRFHGIIFRESRFEPGED